MNMTIEKTQGEVLETRGREPKYPFRKLSEGETIRVQLGDEKDFHRVRSAFFQFRKYHKLKWRVRVQRKGDTLLLHRLNDRHGNI